MRSLHYLHRKSRQIMGYYHYDRGGWRVGQARHCHIWNITVYQHCHWRCALKRLITLINPT